MVEPLRQLLDKHLGLESSTSPVVDLTTILSLTKYILSFNLYIGFNLTLEILYAYDLTSIYIYIQHLELRRRRTERTSHFRSHQQTT